MNREKRQDEHSSQMLAGESRRGDGSLRVLGAEWMAERGCETVSAQLWMSEMRELFRGALGCCQSLGVCAQSVRVCQLGCEDVCVCVTL